MPCGAVAPSSSFNNVSSSFARQNSNTSMRASAWMSSVTSCASALRCGTVERRNAGKARCRTGKRNIGLRACAMGIDALDDLDAGGVGGFRRSIASC